MAAKRKGNGYSDFFEQFVGELFDELGCNTDKEPPVGSGFSEYLATTPDGDEFHIEATVVTPQDFSRTRSTEEDVCRKLQEMCQNPYVYWFTAWADGELYRNMPKGELMPIKRWVEGLSTEDVRAQEASFSFPSGSPPHDAKDPSKEWAIQIHAIPRSEAKQGIPDQLLAGFGRSGNLDAAQPLIRALRAKRKQLRNIELPLVVAISEVAIFSSKNIDVSLALFGWEESAETGVSRITPPKEELRRRSLWGKKENTGISAILLFHGLRPDTVEGADVCLYENPWARHPIPPWLKQSLPLAYVEEQQSISYLHWPSDTRLSALLSAYGNRRPSA